LPQPPRKRIFTTPRTQQKYIQWTFPMNAAAC
jgi:hypothetical protein